MTQDLGRHFLDNAVREFRGVKALADKAFTQVDDSQFFAAPDSETNSIAVNLKHVAGNLRSRWADFLTTDGEKPDRKRDQEFVIGPEDTRAALMQQWERGWQTLVDTLSALEPDDLMRTVPIRGEPHTVVQAVHRQFTHYAYHVGQIVGLAKQHRVSEWKTLSVPRNRSADFNARVQQQAGARERG